MSSAFMHNYLFSHEGAREVGEMGEAYPERHRERQGQQSPQGNPGDMHVSATREEKRSFEKIIENRSCENLLEMSGSVRKCVSMLKKRGNEEEKRV